jgi:hypothetical protein
MFRNSLVAIAAAALAAFVLSSLYYSPLLAGNLWRAVDPVAAAGMTPSLWKVVAEILRTIVITCVVAHLLTLLGAKDWKDSVILGLWLWFGFSAMMWIGAVMWEKTPWQIAAIHSGDWLIKTGVITAMLGLWRSQ